MKLAEVDPAATVTEGSVVSSFVLSDSTALTPPESAGLVSVTVQVVLAYDLRLVGLQASAESFTDPVRLKVTLLEVPLSVAVTVAFWFVTIVPAVAVKVAEVEPAATVAEAGVVSSVLLSEMHFVAHRMDL